jgi:hypothetical protein
MGGRGGAIPDDVVSAVKADATAARVAELLGVALKREGGNFKGRCPLPDHPKEQSGKTPPFTVYGGERGGWKCFSCGKGGGDGIALYQAVRGTDFPETIRALGPLLGIPVDLPGNGARPRATKPRPAAAPAAVAPAAPAGEWAPSAEPSADLRHPELGAPSPAWRVLDAAGRLFALHCRFEKADGKTFAWWRNGAWNLGGVKVAAAPLYGAELLGGWDQGAAVIVTEGEGAADALRGRNLQALATVTGAGSAPYPKSLAVLASRSGPVILWPDFDDVGEKHMARVRRNLPAGLDVATFAPMLLKADGSGGGDAVEWLAARPGAAPWELLEKILAGAVKSRPAEDVNEDLVEAPAEAPEIDSIPVPEFLKTTLRPRPCLIRGLAYDRDAVGIHSFRGDGKSLLAVHLAAHAAAGRDFLAWGISEPVGALYVEGEMAQQEDQDRLAAAVSIAGEPLAPFHILAADFFASGLPSLATPGGQAVVDRILENTPGIRLVILDSVATLCTDPAAPDENSAESWSHSVGPWINSLRRRGCTPVVLYHDNKTGRQRGTSAREDYFAQVLQITRPDDWRRDQPGRWNFTLTKSRGFHSGDARDFEATLGSDCNGQPEWTWRYADAARRDSATKARGKARETKLAAYLREGEELQQLTTGGGLTVKEAADRLGLGKRTAYERLELLREQGCAERGASKDALRTHAHIAPVRDGAESHASHTSHDGPGGTAGHPRKKDLAL